MRGRRASMPPDPTPDPAHEARCLAIARETWLGFDERADVVALLLEVDAILAGRGSPIVSRADRERIEALAKEIP